MKRERDIIIYMSLNLFSNRRQKRIIRTASSLWGMHSDFFLLAKGSSRFRFVFVEFRSVIGTITVLLQPSFYIRFWYKSLLAGPHFTFCLLTCSGLPLSKSTLPFFAGVNFLISGRRHTGQRLYLMSVPYVRPTTHG